MKIEYNSKSIEKVCTNATVAEKKYGLQMAEKIQMRIDQIKASDSINQMIQFHIGRCHLLRGNRKNQFAMELVHPYRLIFEEKDNEIKIANILGIVDYH